MEKERKTYIFQILLDLLILKYILRMCNKISNYITEKDKYTCNIFTKVCSLSQ